MAFLTGVDCEHRIESCERLRLALPAQASLERYTPLALDDDRPRKNVEYKQLVQDVTVCRREESALDELRRLIQKTRKKMDDQTKVLDGFISDVSRVQDLDRNFSTEDDELRALQSWAKPRRPQMLALPPNASVDQSVPNSAIVPAKTRSPGGIICDKVMLRRNDTLNHSTSVPSFHPAAARVSDAFAPLVMPKRRSPPGALTSAADRITEMRHSLSKARAATKLQRSVSSTGTVFPVKRLENERPSVAQRVRKLPAGFAFDEPKVCES